MLSSYVISHSNLYETKQLEFIILCNTSFYGGGFNHNILAPPQPHPALQCRCVHLIVIAGPAQHPFMPFAVIIIMFIQNKDIQI